jgi:hypothetical protein
MKYGRDEGQGSGRISVFKKWNNSTEAERLSVNFSSLACIGEFICFLSEHRITKFVWLLFRNFISGENLHSVGNMGMTRDGKGRRLRLTLEICWLNGAWTGNFFFFWTWPVFLKTEIASERLRRRDIPWTQVREALTDCMTDLPLCCCCCCCCYYYYYCAKESVTHTRSLDVISFVQDGWKDGSMMSLAAT